MWRTLLVTVACRSHAQNNDSSDVYAAWDALVCCSPPPSLGPPSFPCKTGRDQSLIG